MNLTLGDTELIIEKAREYGCLRNQLAYLLATTYHETAHTMKPIKEYGSWEYLDKYDTGKLAKALGNTPADDDDGQKYCGRGYVMITGTKNYKRASRELGVDFFAEPDLVMVPEHAARILITGCMQGWFTGKKISDYITLQKSDFYNARRVVNGIDKAKTISQHAQDYDKLLKEAGYGEEPIQTDVPQTPEEEGKVKEKEKEVTPVTKKSAFEVILEILYKLFS